MAKNEVYIYYSGATDITGINLQKELDIVGGNTKPATKKKLIIGWGAKTKKDTTFGAGIKVLNHPNAIRNNRNKFTSLTAMKAAKVNVADFADAKGLEAAWTGKNLPVVGRTNFHQGGKGFWLCLTAQQVRTAIDEGAQYFQKYIDIQDEFRLHVFNGELLYAQKKVRRDNMEEAFIEQHTEKVASIAKKNNVDLDKNTMDYVLGRLAKGNPNADMIVRSNTRGWKFAQIKNANINKNLLVEAVKALNATKLDFGAVDCCIDADGKAWIIEINSGPGLQGTPFKAYVDAFTKVIAETLSPKKVDTKGVVKKAIAAAPVADNKGGKKGKMREKLSLMNDMLDVAEEDDVGVLERLWSKMADK